MRRGVIAHQPAEHYHYHMLAPLLVVTRNRPAYEQLCRRILATFTNTTNPYWAQRVAIDCSASAKPRVSICNWWTSWPTSPSAEAAGKQSAWPYFQVCKAMSSYRLGRYEEALSWAEKALDSSSAYASAHACAILSMANWRLGRHADARAMLTKGEALAPNIIPERGVENFGGSWVAWLMARISLDEAQALAQPPAAGKKCEPNRNANVVATHIHSAILAAQI